MGLLDAAKRALGLQALRETSRDEGQTAAEEEAAADLRVPEVSSTQLLAEMADRNGQGPVLLDIREPFERAQSYIPDSLHIPMNSIPGRLAELDPEHDIVVYCAHGNRSYGVTGWLIQQGYRARSLKGGIVDWQHKHGTVESGRRPNS